MAKDKKEKEEEKKGRGWHGDSSGHAKAGRMGGKARAKKEKERQEKNK